MKKVFRYLVIIFTCLCVSLILKHIGFYIVDETEENHRIKYIKKRNYSGKIKSQIYNGQKEGYDYVTYDDGFILAKYFFANNNLLNLQEGDSIYQVPGKLLLEIYKKDEKGNYIFDRLSQ